MKKIHLTTLFLVILVLLLTACAFDIGAELYTQDILDAQELGETIYLNATLAFEFSGDEEDKQAVVGVLEGYLYQLGNVREEDRDFSTYLLVDYGIPLLYADEADAIYNHPDALASVFSVAATQDALYAVFNRPRFNALDAELYNQFYQHLELEDFSVSISFQNDMRDPIEVTLYSVYANNIPVPYSLPFTLERRDTLEIRFSNVLLDSIVTPLETEASGITVRKFADIRMEPE